MDKKQKREKVKRFAKEAFAKEALEMPISVTDLRGLFDWLGPDDAVIDE